MTPVLNIRRKLLGWSLVIEFLTGAREAEIFPVPHPPTARIKHLQKSEIAQYEAHALPLTEASNQIRAKQTNPHRTSLDAARPRATMRQEKRRQSRMRTSGQPNRVK